MRERERERERERREHLREEENVVKKGLGVIHL